VVERAVYRSDSPRIRDVVFDPFISPYKERIAAPSEREAGTESEAPPTTNSLARPFKEAIWELKVSLLERALEQARYNQKKAADILGLTYHQFRGLYRQYRKAGG
jgi:psp operon transcriptional activator